MFEFDPFHEAICSDGAVAKELKKASIDKFEESLEWDSKHENSIVNRESGSYDEK